MRPARCQIVPPYLLWRVAEAPELGRAVDPDLVVAIRETLQLDRAFRDVRRRGGLRTPLVEKGGWVVHTARNTAELPGTPVRDQDQPESGDQAVDEAWVGIRAVLSLFAEVYHRASYDGEDAGVSATVHYQRDYANAFWDGSQLVFGDGDGRIFGRMTRAIDVVGHEFTHGVVDHTAGLRYQGQSGALNESVADVFAACTKQRHLGQGAAEGDWLIGAGLLLPGIDGRALRSMAEPGTAYDDPLLGKDPQPAHMADFVETDEDNGGVHLNSGIPNRAFYLAATAIGGSSAQGAGRVWYDALRRVSPNADFVAFARATVEAAGEHEAAVRAAWREVGVLSGDASEGGPAGRADEEPTRADAGSGSGWLLVVSRSGGFVGRTVTGELDLDVDDDLVVEVRHLVERVDFDRPGSGAGYPDAFVYRFCLGDHELRVGEQDLDDDLRRIAEVVLGEER